MTPPVAVADFLAACSYSEKLLSLQKWHWISKHQKSFILVNYITTSQFHPRSDYLGSQLLPGCLAPCRLPSSLLSASHISYWLFFDECAASEIQIICCIPPFKHILKLKENKKVKRLGSALLAPSSIDTSNTHYTCRGLYLSFCRCLGNNLF